MTERALEVKGLNKTYPQWRKESVEALRDVSFDLSKGEVMGLLGPNGAGKTTAIKCICGLIIQDSGSVRFFGEEVKDRVARYVSAVLEGNRNIYWRLSTRENLQFFAGLQGLSPSSVREDIDKLLKTFKLVDKENVPARKLSRGMQQKLALGCALIRDTPLLLLDEPTLGLDVETSLELRNYIKELVRNGDKTILLSSHDMNVVEDVCDRVVIINHGRVVADDTVKGLKDIFKVQAYEIGLNGRWNDLRDVLPEHYDIHIRDSHTTINCQLKDSKEFYRMVDIFKERGIEIDHVKTKEPNFEEIFVKLLGGDKR